MKPELYIGVMSGTSLDGIDVALVQFEKSIPKLLHTHSATFPTAIKQTLQSICQQNHPLSLQEFGELDMQLGQLYGQAILKLIEQTDADKNGITAIGLHGQTIYHAPNGEYPFTLQIGNANQVTALTQIACINDFRNMDMVTGGQGAPLAPAFHQAVFSSPQETRAVINLGGIANITVLNPNQLTFGYDTGPANTLMDQWIHTYHQQPFDQNGEWARSGQINHTLLDHLLEDPYFQKPYPKSTGTEYFNLSWLTRYLSKVGHDIPEQDIQATLCELTAQTIADEIKKHTVTSIYLCGGGAQNSFLIERLQHLLPKANIQTTAALGIDPQWVEACCFAWLAHQYMHNQPGNLPSVTGAKSPQILGSLYKIL